MARPTISLQAAIGDPTIVGTPFIIGTSLIGGSHVIGAATLFGDGAWVELADRCYSVSTRRGRQRFLEQFRAGTLAAVLDNTDGFLDPQTNTEIRSGRAIRLVATYQGVEYPLFYGFVDAWKPSLTYPEGSMVEVSATDGFKILTRIDPLEQAPTGAGDATGDRINRILNLAEWPAEFRDIQGGDNTHQATTLAQPIATQIRLAADSERGDLFIDGRGFVTFKRWRSRYIDYRSRTELWTIGDAAGEINPAAFNLSNDDELVRNDVNIARVGGSMVTRRSIAGEDPAKRSTYTRTDLTLADDAQVADQADRIVRLFAGADGQRVDSVEIEPDGRDDRTTWELVLGGLFGDRVLVDINHPTHDRAGDYFLEGVDHDIPVLGAGRWRTVFSLADASNFPTNPFIIGTSLIGGSDVIA